MIKVDCIEVPTFPEHGGCIIMFKPRIWSQYANRMVEITHAPLQKSAIAAWSYAENFIK